MNYHRVDDWMLMSSPWPTVILCLFYYYMVRFAGPSFMKGRPAYDVQKLMFLYNFLQTLFSLWIFSRLSKFWLSGKYNWVCQPVDYSNSDDGKFMAATVWWYFFSKFTDFMDTFFMVVRHKYNQMTTLHVVHHAMMPVVVWLFLKFVGGGHSTFFMFLNIGVHVVMYFYYFMSSFGPKVQKYLWWKKYITTMQLVQFVTWSIHASTPLFMDCNYPKVYVAFLLFLGAFFFTLFTNFYIQSYVKKPAGEKSKNQ